MDGVLAGKGHHYICLVCVIRVYMKLYMMQLILVVIAAMFVCHSGSLANPEPLCL